MATLALIFPADVVPTSVVLTTLLGYPKSTTTLPLSFAGPTSLDDGRNRWLATFSGAAAEYAYVATATINSSQRPFPGVVAGDGTSAAGQIITTASLRTFLSQSSLSLLAQGDQPSGTIDVPTLQQAILYAEGKVFAVLGQLRARLGRNPPTTFVKLPLTVGGVPILQAPDSIALAILQPIAHRYAVRKLNESRSLQSVAALASSDDPAEVGRGMSMVASAFDKAATAELSKIVKFWQGYTLEGSNPFLDLNPGARIGAPYQEVSVPTNVGQGNGVLCGDQVWRWRDEYGWGWW